MSTVTLGVRVEVVRRRDDHAATIRAATEAAHDDRHERTLGVGSSCGVGGMNRGGEDLSSSVFSLLISASASSFSSSGLACLFLDLRGGVATKRREACLTS